MNIMNNLTELKKLFPKLSPDEVENIKRRHESAEKYWDENLKRFPKEIKNHVIKYLLICEAPPASGNYFYGSTGDYLFKQVWKCFFGGQPICSNSNHAYQCLADIGFLLIDTLPYPCSYKSQHRRSQAYLNLISSYLPVWTGKLNNNFTFSPNLKIAFGFKLNAHAVIQASSGTILLNGIPRALNNTMIAATGAGQPSSISLAQKFGVSPGSFTCTPCIP